MASLSDSPDQPTGDPQIDDDSNTFDSWLSMYGQEEYALYQRSSGSCQLLYDQWSSSTQAAGAYLFFLANDAWESSSDSSGDSELAVINGEHEAQPVHHQGFQLNQTDEKKSSNMTPTQKSTRSQGEFSAPSVPAITVTEDEGSTPSSAQQEPRTPTDENSTPPSIRRGLRARKPVQEKPYEHHAKAAQEQRRNQLEKANAKNSTPKSKSKSPKEKVKEELTESPKDQLIERPIQSSKDSPNAKVKDSLKEKPKEKQILRLQWAALKDEKTRHLRKEVAKG